MTRRFFRDAGIAKGMRVLDIGSGAGNVAFLAAEMVGPSGEVVGTDKSPIAIASAQAADFIASWNFRHIAGAVSRRKLEIALDAIGAHVPTIATPEEIVENLK